ncbi:MAG: Wzz/FepE/Etk N-terminal domain-containing protein, partial [Pseudomonadota bacterium]|nr:Wzz/FepE/Etk N-terminal domain-containing protein [Pseudomonadota bacterium]
MTLVESRAIAPVVSLPSIREVLAVAFRRKVALMLAGLVPVVLALAAATLMTPKYQADSKVLVRSGREYLPQTEGAGGGSEMGPTTTMLDAINTEIEILTGDDLTREVLRKETIARLYP